MKGDQQTKEMLSDYWANDLSNRTLQLEKILESFLTIGFEIKPPSLICMLGEKEGVNNWIETGKEDDLPK